MNTILGVAAACFCVAAVLAIAAVFSVCRKLRLLVSNQLELAQREVVRRLSDLGRRLDAVESRLFNLGSELNEVNQRLDAVGNRLSDLDRELNGISTAVIPDDSAARRAKTEVDKFNEGLFNILTYNGSRKSEDK
jgi:hypothetical protein